MADSELQRAINDACARFQDVATGLIRAGKWHEASAAMLATQWLNLVPGEVARGGMPKQPPLFDERANAEPGLTEPTKPTRRPRKPKAEAPKADDDICAECGRTDGIHALGCPRRDPIRDRQRDTEPPPPPVATGEARP